MKDGEQSQARGKTEIDTWRCGLLRKVIVLHWIGLHNYGYTRVSKVFNTNALWFFLEGWLDRRCLNNFPTFEGCAW